MDADTNTIDALVTADAPTITPDETVTMAKRRMESQTARSLIVVEADRPVGVIQWRGLSQVDGNATVREVMQTEFPVLQTGMSVDAARDYLTGVDVDLDHLPVVNSDGTLIGEAPRASITKSETATTSATREAVGGPEQDRDLPTVHLEQGMTVKGDSGSKLGTVDAVDLDPEGNIGHFTVKHGMLSKHYKRLPSDVINEVTDDTVTVNLDSVEFKMLADIE
jgi:CBS domain-containing protein/sporulation protein YlmC with PRC-barrel domain